MKNKFKDFYPLNSVEMESYKLTCQEYELIYMGIAIPINAT